MNVELALAITGIIGAFVGYLNTRAKKALEVELAAIQARQAAETSDDEIMKQFLKMLEIAWERMSTTYTAGIDRIIKQQEDGQSKMLKAITTSNDQALILMSQAGKSREDWQTAALETFYTLPELTRQKLHESFKQIPLEVGDAVLPRLNELQVIVVKAIDTLETRLIAAISPQAESMQAIAHRDLKEIKDDCQTLFERLNDIHDVLQQIRPETAESTEVKPETFPDPVESTADEAHPLGES